MFWLYAKYRLRNRCAASGFVELAARLAGDADALAPAFLADTDQWRHVMHLLAIALFTGLLRAQTDSIAIEEPAAQQVAGGLQNPLWNITPEAFAPVDPWERAAASSAAASRGARALQRWSVIALIAANAADAASSWQLQEGNPLLAGRGGRFGVQSVMLKSGILGGSLLAQRAITRRRPEWLKRMAWVNFATAGALGAISHRNAGLR